MSDGNFNRALLPGTPYRSGFKMGRGIALKQARIAFMRVMAQRFPHLSEQERGELEALFRAELEQ